jgi:hypothetical protein
VIVASIRVLIYFESTINGGWKSYNGVRKIMRYFHRKISMAIYFSFLSFFAVNGHSTVIDFTVTQITGTQWRYGYSIKNDTLSVPITEFTIFFNRGLYSNLSVAASPIDWDSLVAQPDPAIPADGFFDALAIPLPLLPGGIVPGGTAAGFTVVFDYLGANSPGRQHFDIVDERFNVVDSGFTSSLTAVSAPATLALTLAGIGLFPLLRRRTLKSCVSIN